MKGDKGTKHPEFPALRRKTLETFETLSDDRHSSIHPLRWLLADTCSPEFAGTLLGFDDYVSKC